MRVIDADALMITLMDKNLDQIQGNDGLELCQIIDEQPTIQAVPQGHWIKAKPWMIDYTSCKWECSECEKSERFKYSYCPNCGAKMI